MSLLEKTQALIDTERSLTESLEKVEPWLRSNTRRPTSIGHLSRRVRPIPTTVAEVEQVLAVGRNFASRTSAPAGWNPAAPVVGFSTPNPLPHQLRGGALAALQLERARQEERSQKRKRQEEEEEAAKAKKQAEEEHKSKSDAATQGDAGPNREAAAARQAQSQNVRRASRPQPQVLTTTMNLSDSSSDEDSDEDSD